ncbi:unnamed protein product [Paramecium octaurelia]|uniref:Uncharacterized protein n=1 Tax=Paramecium octaurelia TaxID=43137 RepID=A0A8S1YLD1_PAROT|nr:unnamed protein product [Paramecium octaurelia]
MQMSCNQADHNNQSIIGVCVDITCPNIRPYCNFCLPLHAKHLHMLTPLDLINEWISERILQVHNAQNNVEEFKVSLEIFLNQVSPYCNFNFDQIPKLGLSQIDNLVKGLGSIELCEKVLFRQLNQSIQELKQIVIEIQKILKNQITISNNDNTQIPQYQHKLKPNLSPIRYQLMKTNSIEQGGSCFAFAFNKDCSIVAAGCSSQIIVYEFRQGMKKQIQLLYEHQKEMGTLNFMKKSNQLVSGDCDGDILIWSSKNNKYWICSQTLKQHNSRINCLIMNNNEDIMISCSNDQTIKFWMKLNEWICQQTITNHENFVYQLSLNEKQNKVISCGKDQLILVIENSEQNKQWIVKQKIQVDCLGYRLCFINDNLFTFQPSTGNLMHIYELHNLSKQFTQTKHITVNQGDDNRVFFPQKYIQSKQLLVIKHDKYINLIRKIDNDQFIVEQSIQFSSKELFGCISDDGEYLITWDDSSDEIQIRRSKQE